MRVLVFLLVVLCASPSYAGPTAKRLLSVMNSSSNGPFTTEVTSSFTIPLDWYQDVAATTQGASAVLLGGGGGGYAFGGTSGYAGDKVTLGLSPANYTAVKGYGGAAGDPGGAIVSGGAGYAAGADDADTAGAAGGSSAIKNSSNTLVAQAKGGNGSAGATGGGTSSGGIITVGGANNGGPADTAGGNGGVFLTYYTDPGNFQLSGFETGTDSWTFSTDATRSTTNPHTGSYGTYLYESTYNTAEYSVQKTVTTRAGVMSVWIAASDGGNTGVTGQFHVTVGGTTYNLNSGAYAKYNFNIPAGSTTIKFWFTGHALYHYSMSVDDISIPIP